MVVPAQLPRGGPEGFFQGGLTRFPSGAARLLLFSLEGYEIMIPEPESLKFADIRVFVEDHVINPIEEYLKTTGRHKRPALKKASDEVDRANDAGSLETALASMKDAIAVAELPNVIVTIMTAEEALENRRKVGYETPARPIRFPRRPIMRRAEPPSHA